MPTTKQAKVSAPHVESDTVGISGDPHEQLHVGDEDALDETRARACVRRSLSQALPLPTHDYGPDVVEETIVADLLEDNALLRAPPEAMRERWGEAMADAYGSADGADLSDFCAALARRLGELADARDAARRAREEAEVEGLCALCEREMPLTLHHLIPRELHPRYKARKGLSAQQLAAGVLVCRPCHSAIHRAEDNRTLAESYSTLEALRGHPDIARFAGWAARQRVAGGGKGSARLLRYPR